MARAEASEPAIGHLDRASPGNQWATTPRSRPHTTAALRRFAPILPYRVATWLRTVFGLHQHVQFMEQEIDDRLARVAGHIRDPWSTLIWRASDNRQISAGAGLHANIRSKRSSRLCQAVTSRITSISDSRFWLASVKRRLRT